MVNLYPYIHSSDARAQADFYLQALRGEIVLSKTFAELPQSDDRLKDKILHMRIKVAGQVIFLSDAVREPVQQGNGLELVLEFSDEEKARLAFEGLSAGGKILMPFARQFWGSMAGIAEDRFGIRWQIVTEQ